MPPFFRFVEDALSRHISPDAARFAAGVFSLNVPRELEALLTAAGFTEVTVEATTWNFRLPPPAEFLRQYIHSTPWMALVAAAGDDCYEELVADVVTRCQESDSGFLVLHQLIIVATART